MRKSKFWEGFTPEQYSYIAGINQTVEDKTLIRPHTRYLIASTDYSDGISLRKLGLSTDGFGHARLPYNGTGIFGGFARGMGIFQFQGNASQFQTYFTKIFPQAGSFPNQSSCELDQWAFNSPTKTTLATNSGRGGSPVGVELPTHLFLNGVDALADFQVMQGTWNINGTPTIAPILQQGNAAVNISASASFALTSQFGATGAGNGQFNKPSGIAIDGGGNIYVVDSGNSRVQKFNSSGVYQSQFGSLGSGNGQFLNPLGIFIDSGGNIWITDSGFNNRVQKFNSSGVYQSQFGSLGSGNNQFLNPIGIYVDSSGNIYVCDTQLGVKKFNSSFVYQTTFSGSPGIMPVGITADGSGNFYVTSGVLGSTVNVNVQKFNSSGVYQSQFGSLGSGNGQFHGPFGVAIDGSGNIYVVDNGNKRIQQFNSSNTYLLQFGNGILSGPVFAVNNAGTILVVDSSNNMVYSFSTSSLTGDYGYSYTFVDSNGNESQPAPIGSVNSLSNNAVQLTIMPGTNVTQSVWTNIRVYRTMTNSSPVTAATNPQLWHVPGLDIPVTGATSYTIIDAVPDGSLDAGGLGYTMGSFGSGGYLNGALNTLDISAVPKFVITWNNQMWGGYWNILGVDNPILIQWSASSDNSGFSGGNLTAWAALNNLQVGTLQDGKIIGLWPGLQGRMYVFKEFSTYAIEPTGNAALPYNAVPIVNGYGLYHHSIAEIEGAVIGRAKDNAYQFNGSTFKPLGHNIYKTMGRLIQPNGDSGVYDAAKMRYYLAVCDSQIANSYQTQVSYGTAPTVASSLINCFRNTVLVYDLNSGTWEIHRRTEIQVFGKLKDNGGREKVFMLGVSGDIDCLVDGNVFGPCFSSFGNFDLANLLQSQTSLGNSQQIFQNQFMFIPFVISEDGQIQFMEYSNNVVSAAGTSVYVNAPLPFIDASITCVFCIPNAYDAVTSNAGGINTNLAYDADSANNYSLYNLTQNKPYMWSDGGINVSGSQLLTPLNEPFTPPPNKGDSFVVLPYRWFPNFNQQDCLPVHAFMTPPFGIRLNDMAAKVFQNFRMQIKGAGTLYVYGFKNGNESYQQGPFLCKPDEFHSFPINGNPTTVTAFDNGATLPNSYQQMVNLKGIVSYYMRYMIWMVRGTGWFEIQDVTTYSREMQELANV